MSANKPERPMVPGTLLPVHYLHIIGLIAIKHTMMDQALIAAVAHIADIDMNVTISIFGQLQAAKNRTDILRNLATTKVLDDAQAIKIHVLADQFDEYARQRNILIHSLPYAYGTASDDLTYFRDVNRTYPQIKIQPPYTASIKSLEKLAEDMGTVAWWLGLMLPRFVDSPGDPAKPHWWWTDASQFPWPDKFQRKAAGWNRKKNLLPGSS